jgi:SAM-dependent methyltransferase
MKVFIYGAGNFGAKLLTHFESIGCRVSGFIQTDEPKCEEYLGKKLLSMRLFPKNGIIKVDVTDIAFKDNILDFIIINHVMEHIYDELWALKELYRVLKPSGTVDKEVRLY